MTRSLPTGPIPEGEVKNLGAMGRWAIAWARCGWPVFPCQPRGKEPIGKPGMAPHGFKDATLNEQVIAGWWRREPDANLGGVPELALDIDRPLIFKTWEFYAKVPQDAVTGSSSTKGHILMNLPEGWSGELETKFEWGEIRGNGMGYIILPPSVHPDGSVYRFRKTGAVPVAPDDLLVALTKPKTNGHDGEPVPLFGGSYRIPDFGYTGSRYDAIRDYVAHLWNKHLSDDELFGLVRTTLAPRFAETLTEAELRDRFERTMKKATERLGEPAGSVTINAAAAPERDPGTIVDLLSRQVTADFPADPWRDAYGGLIGELTEAALPHTDASKVGLLGALLVTLGSMLPAQCGFHGRQTTALYVCLVGDSSTGRKGTTMYYADEAVRAALDLPFMKLSGAGVNSGEAVINHLARQQAKALFPVLRVYEEEYSRLLVVGRREGTTVDSVLRAGFDGRMLATMKAAGALEVDPPYILSALAGITRDELRTRMSADGITNGAANRWLWLPVTRRAGTRASGSLTVAITFELKDAFKAAKSWVGSSPTSLRELALSAEAKTTAEDYEQWLLTSTVGTAQQLARRFHTHAVRIALLHATVERSVLVSLDHVRRGIALTEYARAGLAYVFGESSGNEWTDLLVRQAEESPGGYLTGNDICQYVRDPRARQLALDVAERLGVGRVERIAPASGSKGGRPKTRFYVNRVAQPEMPPELARALHPEPVALTSVEPVAEDAEADGKRMGSGWHAHAWADRDASSATAPWVCKTCGKSFPAGGPTAFP